MKRIKGFTVTKVALSGFKCFEKKTDYDFGDMTFICGANGLGKSTIADGIAFVFTGTTFFGEQGIDKLQNPNAPELKAEVQLADEAGEIHNLIRTRKKGTATIQFDGYTVRQSDINEIFCDKDLFLAMFNPQYAIETIGTEAKRLLEKLLPTVEHEDILNELPESVRIQMEKEPIASPEYYLKKIRAEIKEQEENLIYMQGQSDLQDMEKKEAVEAKNKLVEWLNEVREGISTLESKNANKGLNKEEIECLANLYVQRDEINNETEDENVSDEIRASMQNIEAQLEGIKAMVYQSTYANDIATKEAELKGLYEKYASITDVVKNIAPGYHCPTCYNEITIDNAAIAKSKVDEKQRNCVFQGTAAKAALALLREKEQEDKASFLKDCQVEISTLEQKLCLLKQQYDAEENENNTRRSNRAAMIGKLNDEIQMMEYKKGFGTLSVVELEQLKIFQQQEKEIQYQIELQQNILDKPNLSAQMDSIRLELNRLKTLMANAYTYTAKKNELLFKDIQMNRVKIVLYEVIKSTGEIKDTFKFTYDDKEYRCLSLSEKIKAGIEITELIKRRSGLCFPTFVDNSESICIIDNVRPSSQMIFSRVEKGRQLSVSTRNNGLRKVS